MDERKGRIDAKLIKLFSKEDLEKLSASEIDRKINEALTHDDYLWNEEKKIHYETHGHIAKDLHYICYKCPTCGEEFAMADDEERIYCKRCGAGAHIDDTYALTPLTKKTKLPKNLSNWFDWERQCVYREIKHDSKFVFEEHVKLGKLDPYKPLKNKKTSFLCGEGDFRIDHTGVTYKGNKDGKDFSFHMAYEEINTFAMPTDTSYLSLYYAGEYYDIYPEGPTSIKMLLLVEEMHRLHVNKWKALPNESWIYE